MLLKTLLTLGVVVTTVFAAASAFGQPWHSGTDFSSSNPTPTGWEYGYLKYLDADGNYAPDPYRFGAFVSYLDPFHGAAGMEGWQEAGAPFVGHNKTVDTITQEGAYLVEPNQLIMHPNDPQNAGNTFNQGDVVVRWTAPAAGAYNVWWEFVEIGANGDVNAKVYTDSNPGVWSSFLPGSPLGEARTSSAVLNLAAGEKVWFVVEPNGTGATAHYGDGTGFTATIDVAPPGQPGQLEGVVAGLDNQMPVSAAKVELVGTSFSMTTEADGKYQFSNVPSGSYTLRAGATGFVTLDTPATVPDGATATVNVALKINNALRQTWDAGTDFAKSNPASTGWEYGYLKYLDAFGTYAPDPYRFGAFVSYLDPFHGAAGMEGWQEAGAPFVGHNKTGAAIAQDGAYNVEPNQLVIHPNAPQEEANPFNQGDVVVRWTAPAAGAYNVSWEFKEIGGNGDVNAKVYTDSNPSVWSAFLPGGPLGEARASSALLRLAAGEKVWFVVDPNGTGPTDHWGDGTGFTASITVAPPGQVQGVVTASNNQRPISAAKVELIGTSFSMTTGADGKYQFSDVPPGNYTLRAGATGFVTKETPITVPSAATATVDVALDPGQAWDAGTDFSISANPTPLGWEYGYLKYLDADGNYAPDPYRFGAMANYSEPFHGAVGTEGWADGGTPFISHNKTGATITQDGAYAVEPNKLAMHPGDPQDAANLFNQGDVVVRWTAPAAGAYNVSWEFKEIGGNGDVNAKVYTDSNPSVWSAFLPGSPVGETQASSAVLNLAAGEKVWFVVDPNGTGPTDHYGDGTGFTATIGRLGQIQGVVAALDTQMPVSAAKVELAGTSFSMTTGADGKYQFSEVPPGNYTLRAGATGFATKETPITVSSGATVTVNVALNPAVRQSWDAGTDFSNSNPSNGWEYGYLKYLDAGGNYAPDPYRFGAFVSYQDPFHSPAGLEGWADAGTPFISHNKTGAAIAQDGAYNVEPNQLVIHPNAPQEEANPFNQGDVVVRWTAPAAGAYNVSWEFKEIGAGGDVNAKVYTDSNPSVWSAFLPGSPVGEARASSALLNLAAGEKVWFVVDPNGTGPTDHWGDGTGFTASITVAPPGPVITVEPQSATVIDGLGTTTFTVGAASTKPLSYQWQFKEQNLPGETGLTLTRANVAANAGNYRVIVSDPDASVTSQTAVLTVESVPGPVRAQDGGADGLVVLEAEHFNRKVAASDHEWVLVTNPTGFSGDGAMQAQPDSGLNLQSVISASPRMDFKVQFAKTGTYHVWVRGLGDSSPGPSASDSVHVGLDNTLPASSDRISTFPQGAGYVWSKTTLDAGAPATFDVASAGLHFLHIWMREDGFIADKILLTLNPDFTPTDVGPAESLRQSWDAGTDFSNSNPSNGWEYGYLKYLDAGGNYAPDPYRFGAFVSYQDPFHAPVGLEGWADAGTPFISHNKTGATIAQDGAYVVEPNKLVMHPNDPQDAATLFNQGDAVVRWTAPAAGAYNVSWEFKEIGAGGDVNAKVYTDSNPSVWSAFLPGSPVGDPHASSALLRLAAGEKVWFVVDPNGTGPTGHYGDGTGFTATIAVATVQPIIKLSSPTLTGNMFSLSVTTGVGATYILEFKNSLNDAVWQELGSFQGDGKSQILTDTAATGPSRFYRIRVQ